MSNESIELGHPAGGRRPGGPRHLLLAVAAAGLGFQAVHSVEHLLQLGYWLAHPTSPAWLTPWAEAGRDGLAALTDRRPMTGMELLHLLGNAIFLAGLCATLAVVERDRAPQSLMAVTWPQAAHVAEWYVVQTVLSAGWSRQLSAGCACGRPDGWF